MGIFKHAGIAAIGFVGLTCAASIGVAADASDNFADPLELFSRIAPVFKHPRCANCHGGVNPRADAERSLPNQVEHGGDVVDPDTSCSGCHDSKPAIAANWRLAPMHLVFHGKSTKQLCDLQARFASGDHGNYLRHVSTDDLIGIAFEGDKGGAGDVDKPRMGRDEFVQKAALWLSAGNGKCSRWKGTITQTETFESDYVTAGPAPNVTVAVKEKATRVVKIQHELNGTTATIEMSGDQKMITTAHESGPRGPCTVTMTSYRDWSKDVRQPARTAGVQFEIGEEGWYKVHLTTGGEETTVELEHGEVADQCGTTIGPPNPASTKLDWPVWSFTIPCTAPLSAGLDLRPDVGEMLDCKPFDARTWPRLKGKLIRIVDDQTTDSDPQSWLAVSPVSTARAVDGKVLPVKVETEWDFVLVD